MRSQNGGKKWLAPNESSKYTPEVGIGGWASYTNDLWCEEEQPELGEQFRSQHFLGAEEQFDLFQKRYNRG